MPSPPDRYVVIGQPVAHSRSPAIHARFADATGQSIRYERLPVPVGQFNAYTQQFFNAGGHGANVTVPFKVEAAQFADSLTNRARAAAAVNTLWQTADGRIWGDNTDGAGLVCDLRNRLAIELTDANVLILGAGGAVRGAVPALLAENPARLTIANRTYSKAKTIADAVGKGVVATPLDSLDQPFDLVINAISAGLTGGMPAVPEIVIGDDTTAYDMLYAEIETPFINWARARGVRRASDGFGMLVEQAAESFYLWRGVRPDTTPVIAELAPTPRVDES